MTGGIAVIGGGYTGTALAVALLRGGARVTLIERRNRPGRGLAYSTEHPEHLLNARASRMSATPDDPDHFARWWAPHGGDPAGFAPRRLYGDYVEEWAAGAFAAAGDRLTLIDGEAVAVDDVVRLADGRAIGAEQVVLALGNWVPPLPAGLPEALATSPLYRADPWTEGLGAGLGNEDAVLLIGTGLTAVDAALVLAAEGFGGRIVALSRRGLLPRAHGIERAHRDTPPAGLVPRSTALLRQVREEGERIGWASAVNSLRPATQALWQAASLEERRRFLRHLRPWWDVHRHRIAPEIDAQLGALAAAGRFAAVAGRIVNCDPGEDGAEVRWRVRGSDRVEGGCFVRIVNCTGTDGDVTRLDEPLVRQLLAAGRIRPDPLRIGIDVDRDCRAIGADGRVSPTLSVAGPPTRGTFWEIVAVPDLREQVARLARHLLA